jgi:GNAT superfamily N-acetyltransferase
MDLTATADAGLFAPAVQPVLDRYPVAANVLATVLGSALSGSTRVDDPLWLLLSVDGEPVGAAMNTLPGWLFVTPLPDGLAQDAAQLVAAEFGRLGRSLDGVSGTVAEATALARVWSGRTGRAAVTSMTQRMYELVEPPADALVVPGSARPAGPQDIALLRDWMEAFHAEADPDGPSGDLEQLLTDRVARGLFLLWTDGGRATGVAGFNEPAAGVARIGPVYTPPEHRRRGYGGAVTAAASRAGFERGAQRCMLYTDLANPTSNGVYERLGYTPVTDAVQLRFEPAGRPSAG